MNEEQLRAELEITVKNEKKLKTIKKRIQIDFILEETVLTAAGSKLHIVASTLLYSKPSKLWHSL